MNFELTDDQEMIRETFARFLAQQSSMARVREAMPTGFDRDLWKGLAEMGGLSIRVPESSGGLGLGCFEATLLMEECGRALASGPVAEAIVAARSLAFLSPDLHAELLARVLSGDAVVTLAFADIAEAPVQVVAGGLVAESVIARDGDRIVLLAVPEGARQADRNLASTPLAEMDLGKLDRRVLAAGEDAVNVFRQGIEEWKLLIAAALSGLSEAALRLASEYACERIQFGQPIGMFQAIAHPLADRITDTDGGRYFLWKTLRDVADRSPAAGAEISLAAWWAIQNAGRVAYQAVHTYGGYGLTTEYDIHLYNLRAKAWPLAFGDPASLLEEAGRRLYAGEAATLPDVGTIEVEFGYGAEAEAFAAEVDAFFARTLTDELRAKGSVPWDGHDPDVHRKLAQADLLFPSWPKEDGGRGVSPYAVQAARDVWSDHGWQSSGVGVTGMVATIIRKFGSDELKRDVLPRLRNGEAICSLGFSEPGSGSDVFAAQCRSTRDGDGWRIDGTKMFTSGANISDYVLLLTRTDSGGRKHEGLTMFVVPLKGAGVEVQPVYTFIDERTNVTFYDGVRVPDSYRLGEAGKGVQVMAASLSLEQSGAAFTHDQGKMVKAAESICRKNMRDGRRLIEHAGTQSRLARAYAHVEITRMISLRALWSGVNGKPDKGFGAMSKLFSSEAFRRDSADLLDLTAPHSLLDRTGPAGVLNLSYRHAHGTTVYGGTSEVHRSIIAERNLQLPRSRA